MSDWSENNFMRHALSPLEDARFNKLCRLYGEAGYCYYFMALEHIYKGVCGPLEVEMIAATFGKDPADVMAVLVSAETDCAGLLFRDDAGNWHSSKAAQILAKDEQKREDKRTKSREYRERMKGGNTWQNVPTRTDTRENAIISFDNGIGNSKDVIVNNGEGIINNINNAPTSEKSPLPPSSSQVTEYLKAKGRRFNVDRFLAYYTARKWIVDGVPVNSATQWHALADRWPDDYASDKAVRQVDEASLVGVVRGAL